MRMSKSINHWAQWVGGDCFFFLGGTTPSNRYHLFIVHPSFFCLSGCGGGWVGLKKRGVCFCCVVSFQSW